MPTRRQNPETREFRQSAFSSSSEYERGILANLVAARCHALTDAEQIAMIWWLQQVSWREGGLEKFAEEFIAHNRTRIGPPTLLKFGYAPDRLLSAEEVRAVRKDFPRRQFLLKGERDEELISSWAFTGRASTLDEANENAKTHPDSYRASAFIEASAIDPWRFAEELKRALVDPSLACPLAGLWNFPTLGDALKGWRQREIVEAGARIVETAVTRQVSDELDFALETRSFVLLEGREGIGKSEAARTWCDTHPGRAIYVRLEAGSDETTLYRSIARRIGTACSYQRKAVEMRARIQDALQGGHMMLVLDEAHFLWPQGGRSERGVPKRMDWVRTALVDFGVPVALVSTPQYFARQCDRFRKAGWNANQVQRRLARTVTLPETLDAGELLAVAKSYFADSSKRLLAVAATAAQLSVARLTMFSHLRKRVDFLRARRNGLTESELLEIALKEIDAPGLNVGRDEARSNASVSISEPAEASAVARTHRAAVPPTPGPSHRTLEAMPHVPVA